MLDTLHPDASSLKNKHHEKKRFYKKCTAASSALLELQIFFKQFYIIRFKAYYNSSYHVHSYIDPFPADHPEMQYGGVARRAWQ
jgi:hypothetical protein